MHKMKEQKMCKCCGGFVDSGEIPKTEIAPDNWCYRLGHCRELCKMPIFIEKIFNKLGIEGDIDPLETDEDFWKRKLIEVHEKMSERFLNFANSQLAYTKRIRKLTKEGLEKIKERDRKIKDIYKR